MIQTGDRSFDATAEPPGDRSRPVAPRAEGSP